MSPTPLASLVAVTFLVPLAPKPIVVPFGDIEVHCPKDNRNGEWKSVEIPFRAFTGGV